MEKRSRHAAGLPILVIEDEEAIMRGLCDVLAFRGYSPSGAERGDLGLERALDSEQEPALVVLDVMLPGLSGFDVCERLREQKPWLPILMLTARGSEEDVLRGFSAGADDYVTKPFSVSELIARVEALLRRSQADGGEMNEASSEPADALPFTFGEWQIDPEQRAAQRAEQSVALTTRDLEILACFVRERGRIVSRRLLLAEIWGYPDPERVETRSVDMHIAKLRKKLGPDDGALIETVRGEGYRYRG